MKSLLRGIRINWEHFAMGFKLASLTGFIAMVNGKMFLAKGIMFVYLYSYSVMELLLGEPD